MCVTHRDKYNKSEIIQRYKVRTSGGCCPLSRQTECLLRPGAWCGAGHYTGTATREPSLGDAAPTLGVPATEPESVPAALGYQGPRHTALGCTITAPTPITMNKSYGLLPTNEP